MARVRIGAVRLKGGATLRIFHNDIAVRTTAAYDRGAVAIRRNRAGDMAGYAIVAWGYAGGVSVDSLCGDGRAVNPMNLAQFVAAAITDQRTRVNAEYDIRGIPREDEPA